MSYGFKDVNETKQYLRTPGLHVNAKFVGLKYEANENWEAFDIELETSDGKFFRERTFGPNVDKVYPKALYKDGQKVGMETKDQAFDRVKNEINKKLFYLALCFVDKVTLTEKCASVRTLKELITTLNQLLENTSGTINFLTIWKNSDVRQKSNLILAERIKWCEPYVENVTPTIKLSTYQQANQTVEKYPYSGTETVSSSDVILNNAVEENAGAVDDLPF